MWIICTLLTYFSTCNVRTTIIFATNKTINAITNEKKPKKSMMKSTNSPFAGLNRKLILLLMSFMMISGIFAQNITNGLIMHYTFDDVTATIVPDASGNNQIATLQGATEMAEGYSGMGVKMLTKPDYVQLPSNFTVGLTSFTFAAWVKMDQLKNATRFFDLGNGADATNNFFVFIPSAGGDNTFMRVRYRESTGTGANLDVPATNKVPVGAWAHVALTLNWNDASNNGVLRVYLNGVQVASTSTYPYNPSMLGAATADNFLGRSRWNQDANGFNGTMDDVRFYNRALTSEDVIALTGLAELNKQFEALTLGNISEGVTGNLNLPLTLGTQGVKVSWKSSKPQVIDTTGVVNRPAKFDVTVTLTALLSLELNGKVNTMTKVFNVKVLGVEGTPELIAKWNFDPSLIAIENDTIVVTDATDAGYKAKLINDAKVRTIGNTTQYNVLDLGNGTGFMDMGRGVGEAIYALGDYTIMGYFRVHEDYTALTSAGNFLYAFSNTPDANADRNGYVIGRLNVTGHQCTKFFWGNTDTRLEVAVGSAPSQGVWHHYAYVQQGNVGKIFIDGVLAKEGPMPQVPSTTIALPDRDGTWYNWIGRSIGLSSDVYLRQTLVYDFNIYSIPLTGDNLVLDLEIPNTISMLNNAYTENPDYKSPALQSEHNNLSMSNLTAVTSNIALPTQGTLDPSIQISWSSSHPQIISNTGEVTRPDYFDFEVSLTATLKSGVNMLNKSFTAKVLAKEGTAFNSDLLAKFDFSHVEGRFVNDVAEKKFRGMTVNDARIRTIGTNETGQFNVLDLGNGTGYFDMGEEIGKTLYHLNDYTISAYYRIDPEYTELNSNGNFIWTFSNTDDAMTRPTGYIIGSLKNLSNSITPGNYTAASGNQTVAFNENALKGNWHHIAYVQNGTSGTLYLDGMPVIPGDITNTPASALKRAGRTGTQFNWIGRSNYVADVYLRNTLVYDFRLYKKALNDFEILATELNVAEQIEKLELAFAALPDASSVQELKNAPYLIQQTEGAIRIVGLKGTERVVVSDVSGRIYNASTKDTYRLNPGIYIIKIDNYGAKIAVK